MVNESNLNDKIKEKIKTLATKAELKAEQNKIVKLQIYDSSLFIGQSYFNNDTAQLYWIFKPVYKTIKTFSGLKETISEWKSKGLSNEKLTCAYIANVSVHPKLIWIHNTRIRWTFKASCLRQDNKDSC